MLKHVSSSEFKKEVLGNNKVVLVDFFATWCPPCRMLSPILEKISESRSDFDIVKIDIDENQDLAYEYKIEVVPTMVVFKEGRVVDKVVGSLDEKKIIELVSGYIK